MRRFLLTLQLLLAITPAFCTGNDIELAILSDLHVTPGSRAAAMLKDAVNEINNSKADAVVVCGDLTNEGSDAQLQYVKTILDAIIKPHYIIPGNHENNWSQSACSTFPKMWGNDRFVFEIGNTIFTGVNCGPYMKMGDGHIKQEDLLWLKRTLQERMDKRKRLVSFCHYPLNADLDNYTDMLDIVATYPTICHVNGHYHAWQHYKAGVGMDGYTVRSLQLKDDSYGYGILKISADSLYMLNKELGSPATAIYAEAINTATSSARHANTHNHQFVIEQAFQDNASIFTIPAVDNNHIYVGNSSGYVKAISKRDNTVVWQYKTTASVYSRPAVTGECVILPTASGVLLWLDKANGILRGQHKDSTPYVADGVIQGGVLYQGGYKKFTAWDAAAQKALWETGDIHNYCQAAPCISGDYIVFGAWDTFLRCLNKKDGTLVWQWSNGKSNNQLSPGNCVPVVTGDRVIIVAPDRYMTAISLATGKTIWRDNSHKFRESLGASADGTTVYAKTMDGEIVAVSATANTYSELWVTDTGLGYEHAPCTILEHNGLIYAGSRRGIIVAVDTVSHQKILEYKLGNSEINGWCVDAAGDIYLTLVEGSVWRIRDITL